MTGVLVDNAVNEQPKMEIRTDAERWLWEALYRSQQALAVMVLDEMNRNRESPEDWPAGQEWQHCNGSSHAIFSGIARRKANIDHGPYLALLRTDEIAEDIADKVYDEMLWGMPCDDIAAEVDGLPDDAVDAGLADKGFCLKGTANSKWLQLQGDGATQEGIAFRMNGEGGTVNGGQIGVIDEYGRIVRLSLDDYGKCSRSAFKHGLDQGYETGREAAQRFNAIDYDNPETWPDSNKPIIRAWERGLDGKSKAFTEDKYSYVPERNERGNKLITRDPSGGIVGVFGKDEATNSIVLFTHWCYAPIFGAIT